MALLCIGIIFYLFLFNLENNFKLMSEKETKNHVLKKYRVKNHIKKHILHNNNTKKLLTNR